MAWKFPRIVLVLVLVSAALWTLYGLRTKLHSNDEIPSEPVPESHVDPVVEAPRHEIWGIRDLNADIDISSLHIRTVYDGSDLPLRQHVDIPVPLRQINLAQPTLDLPFTSVTINAPGRNVPDASSLLIGMATKLGRLKDALPAFTLWASGTNVKFVVIVEPQPADGPSVQEIVQLYKDHDISLQLIESEANYFDQYTSLLGILYDHAHGDTKWACIMDDDTFFPSMNRVLSMLRKYDASEPHYIGGLSENKESMDRLGYFGFGGAGIFLSLPLLKQLRPYNEACIKLPDDAGDTRVAHCINTFSTTKFTWEHYLFQLDLHGDVTGFYEAVRTIPVSVHHWKSWHFHDMVKVGAVSRICGNECILQKYQFADGWMMTNGFSFVKYSYTEEETLGWIEGAMEHTWADTPWVIPTSWNYTLAPLKPKDKGKVQYLIEKVDEGEQKATLYYVKRQDGLGTGIIRVLWEKTT